MRKKLDNISHGKPSAEPSSLKASQLSNTANILNNLRIQKHMERKSQARGGP